MMLAGVLYFLIHEMRTKKKKRKKERVFVVNQLCKIVLVLKSTHTVRIRNKLLGI